MGAALTLLARRDRSRRELRERLAARFPDTDLEPLLDELTRLGYLDDRRLARRLAEELATRRHHGPRRLRHELARRGLDAERVAEAVAPHAGADRVREQALAATRAYLKGRSPDDDATLRRLAGYLGRRGFPEGAIRAMVHLIRQGSVWDNPQQE
ncbi:MAG: RecX family transcriptional regulator [Nitrospirae bacterium]|nr:RecX family transcriptional regulator [Nitrospirota bacterium]